jgi:hypothetical protein
MIRTALAAIALSVGLSVFAARADAPVADLPIVKVGSSWDYADRLASIPCKHWVFTGVKDGYVLSECQGYKAFASLETGNLVRILDKDGDKAVQFSPQGVTLNFPLKVGKKWEGKYSGYTADDGAQWDATSSCEVKAYEKVAVPAGDFDAFRIECTDAWQSGPAQGRVKVTTWWSPKAAAVVKNLNPDVPKWNAELTGYSLK